MAVHDALANNASAQERMGDELLMTMARELAARLRARLHTMIKNQLNRYKYPQIRKPGASSWCSCKPR